jgi:hypothetical protein
LADADAQGRETEATSAALQLVDQRAEDSRSRAAERVADRDRSAIRIDDLGIELGPLGEAAERLRRERLPMPNGRGSTAATPRVTMARLIPHEDCRERCAAIASELVVGKTLEVDQGNERVLQLMQAAGLVVPMLGAGVSESAKLSGSRALAEALLQGFESTSRFPDPETHLAAVVDFLSQEGVGERAILDFVAARIAAEEPAESPLVEALIRVPSRLIVTLNFDLAIESAERANGGEPVILGNGRADLKRALKVIAAGSPPDELTVLHLHGSVERPEEMVLGADGYARVDSDLQAMVFQELAVHRVLAFYGTTLDEPYLLAQLQRIPHRGSHVLWCREADRRELTRGRNAILPSRSNIYIGAVRYFEDLPATLAPLLGGALPQAARVRPTGVLKPDVDYVTNSLRDRRNPNDPEDVAFVSFGLEPRGEVKPEPTEDDVLDGLRTIVVGDPGSGKSELLRSLASRSKGSRIGLFIRLADVAPDRGLGPVDALAAWAKTSRASRRGVDVAAAAIEAGRFHFFLDGLDEVDSALHDDFARLINRFSTELPQHAFTVSTRPLPGLALLRIDSREASDWDQYELVPDRDWRDRYLTRRDVTLEVLLEKMPALADMEEVLVTPFFLRHIVDLHGEDRLGGQRDIGDLLATLIDAAVTREHGKIDLAPGSIRRWLQGIALASTISGTRTFSAADLDNFPFPGGSEEDPVALARDLEHRLLIAEDSGSFRFHHRLLGEQLAAEALVEEGPAAEIRDCLVPYVDDGLSGVRPDVAVTVGLACLRSKAWRTAVTTRDRRAAARATPRDAPVKERSAALRTLWDAAVDAQVWVWDHGPGLTDDAEAMIGLVCGLPGGRVTKEMRRAIHAGSSQDQGNAIHVLAGALPNGLEPALRKVLRDPSRNGVVLRQAASAASDCGFVGLIDDITDMLVGQEESVVHQNGIAALRTLMGEAPRLDVYRRLISGPEANYALAAVHDELDPGDLLVLLSDHLRSGVDRRMLPRRLDPSALFSNLSIEHLTGETLEAAVRVAVLFDVDSEILQKLKDADPALAVRTLAGLIEESEMGWYHAFDLASLYTASELRDAGVAEDVIERTEQRRAIEVERVRLAAVEVDRPRQGAFSSEADDERTAPPTLADLLEDPDGETNIIHNAEYFAPQVGDLDQRLLEDLRKRLGHWWPRKDYRSTITRTSHNSWRQEWKAAAWIWLGPAARPTLSPRQWGQLASCGILYSTQSEWLRAAQSVAGVYEAIDAMGDDGDPDRWAQLLDCCADPLPNRLLVRCAEALAPVPATDDSGHRFRVRAVLRRFVESGRSDLTEQLVSRGEEFSTIVPPLLAEGGDLHSQEAMIEQLMGTLDEGNFPEDDQMTWMDSLDSPSLLPGLFGILRRVYRLSDEPVRGVTIGYGPRDVVNPTVEAISRIGGRGAVAGYDELIDQGGDFRWLSGSRDRVASNLLTADGERFAASAAASVGLPLIGAPPGAEDAPGQPS